MFFHLLDFRDLILWSVAPAPGAKPYQVTASGEDVGSWEQETLWSVQGLSGTGRPHPGSDFPTVCSKVCSNKYVSSVY